MIPQLLPTAMQSVSSGSCALDPRTSRNIDLRAASLLAQIRQVQRRFDAKPHRPKLSGMYCATAAITSLAAPRSGASGAARPTRDPPSVSSRATS
jgi:hypothetical protein